jgi:hypothetical protein
MPKSAMPGEHGAIGNVTNFRCPQERREMEKNG